MNTTDPWARRAAGAALVVAALDAAQVLLLAWRPKFVFTVAGAVLYGALALLARGGRARGPGRLALFVLAAMPVVPLGSLVARALGAPTPVDAAMLAIFAVQLAAAASAMRALGGRAAPAVPRRPASLPS